MLTTEKVYAVFDGLCEPTCSGAHFVFFRSGSAAESGKKEAFVALDTVFGVAKTQYPKCV